MSIREIAIGAVGFFLGGIAHSFVIYYFMPNAHRLYAWIYALRKHHKYGEPCKTDIVLKKDGYSLGYNFDHRTALWVSYIMTKGSVGIDVARSESFYADPEIPERFRVRPEAYTNTGFDKGHLAPSAAIDFTVKSNQETFSMTNVALQDPKLNRQGWSKIESLEREWTYTLGKMVVYTGPVFSARPKKVNEISVPKAFYKVAYSFKYHRYIGFIIPNEPVRAKEVWGFAMPVTKVEKELGMKFFAKINDGNKKDLDLEFWKEAHL